MALAGGLVDAVATNGYTPKRGDAFTVFAGADSYTGKVAVNNGFRYTGNGQIRFAPDPGTALILR